MNAIEKYNQRVDRVNSLLCVGMDSDINRLPNGAAQTQYPQRDFNYHIIDETVEYAAAYKFNIAFYEARGEQGIAELKASVQFLHDTYPDVLAICDAKRSDIGNTSAAYAQAIFDYLGFDAVTLNPYLGRTALQPFLEYEDKGCIILCRTSNQGSGEFQNLLIDNTPMWQIVAQKVSNEWNDNNNCMLVIGANHPQELQQVRDIVGNMTLLIPGIGAQGGDIQAVMQNGLNSKNKGLIISSSRGIIFNANPKIAAQTLRDQINEFRT